MPVNGSKCFDLTRPVSTTYVTPGIVMDVSAMLVATTTSLHFNIKSKIREVSYEVRRVPRCVVVYRRKHLKLLLRWQHGVERQDLEFGRRLYLGLGFLRSRLRLIALSNDLRFDVQVHLIFFSFLLTVGGLLRILIQGDEQRLGLLE